MPSPSQLAVDIGARDPGRAVHELSAGKGSRRQDGSSALQRANVAAGRQDLR